MNTATTETLIGYVSHPDPREAEFLCLAHRTAQWADVYDIPVTEADEHLAGSCPDCEV